MIWQLDIIILFIVVICALAAITVKDLLSSAILLGAYSFLMCLQKYHTLHISVDCSLECITALG